MTEIEGTRPGMIEIGIEIGGGDLPDESSFEKFNLYSH